MERKIKCTQCGNGKFFRTVLNTECTDGNCYGLQKHAVSYSCFKCGHIEWFVRNEILKAHIDAERKNELFKQKVANYERRRKELRAQIIEVQRIVNDENQIMKVVNEARQKLAYLQNELQNLRPPQNNANPWGI